MAQYKVTQHGRERLKDRAGISRKPDVSGIFRKSLHEGKSPADFDEPFSSYLRSKLNNGCQIKVYSGMIFVYKNRTLITAYEIPPMYKTSIHDNNNINRVHKNFVGVKGKYIVDDLEHSLNMFDSLLIIGNSINLRYDDETYGEMVEKCEEIKDMCYELYERMINNQVMTRNNIDLDVKGSIDEINKLQNNLQNIMKNKDTNEIKHSLEEIISIMNYVKNQKFFLIQNQVIKNSKL